jgi:hypothetical protein
MGIMAKELEMTQMIQLLSMTQQGTPPFNLLLKGIFENSSMANRDEMKAAIDQMMQPEQPTPEQMQMQQMVQEMEMMKIQLELEEMKAGIQKEMAQAAKITSEINDKQSEEYLVEKQMELAEKMARIEKLRTDSQMVKSETQRNIPEVEHLKSETILNLATARMKSQGR